MHCADHFLVLGCSMIIATSAGADVLQHHNNGTRDGLYVDPLITRDAVANTHRDFTFRASLPGPTYAQPLYVSNGPEGTAALIVATSQNEVLALNASTGMTLWKVNVGAPVPSSTLPCGNIDPVGITSTPVIDIDSRRLYVAAMATPDGGATRQHLIHALRLDDGSTVPGWPVDVGATASFGGLTFNPTPQNQRGALLLSGPIVYVPYGGHYGDCGDYHGWVVGVPQADPRSPMAWATGAGGGGIWAPSGLATDGTFVYAATGNTIGTTTWMGGEAIIRFTRGPAFSDNAADYFTPSNWFDLDNADLDVGGTGPVLIDVPGATPSALLVGLGKNGVAYLVDRGNLGGIGTGDGVQREGVASELVATGEISNAAAAYTTDSGTYVVFNVAFGVGVGCPLGQSGDLVALRIGPSSPPTINIAWCAQNQGRGSPIVTTTDGRSEAVIWTTGAFDSNRLHGFDGETGQVLFNGGGEDEQMTAVRHFQTPIAVNGRIFVAADDQLYAFTTQ
jgi:outer membrane protein assembly factor BamB